jgi:hypothetical protein
MITRPETASGHGASFHRYVVELGLAFFLGGALLLPGYIEVFPENVFGQTYGRWRAQLDFVARPGPGVEILIAGDSRAHAALLPERLGPGARSIALAGATAIETHALLRRYLEHHPPPRTLLLSIAPYHFEKADVFWGWTIKWKALRTPEALEIFQRAEAFGDPVLGEPDERSLSLRFARLRLNYVGDYARELRNSRTGTRGARFRREYAQVTAARGHAPYGEDPENAEPNREAGDPDGFQTSPLLDSYLRDTLALAARHDVRVVYAAMPVNQASWRRIEPGYLAAYHRHVVQLAAEHPSADFRGFLWTLPDDHFGDASHVNERGARRVTDWLAPLL